MKLKRIVQLMLIGCSLTFVVACSTAHKKGMGADGAEVTDENAQASGAGQGQGFGDDGANGRIGATSANKRTYYFDFDRSNVHEEDRSSIQNHADYLVSHQNKKAILEGHTDPRGSREYNVALGERRANAVHDVLKSRGINPDQVRVVSYGAEKPAVPGRNEQDYQLDRRVVLDYDQG